MGNATLIVMECKNNLPWLIKWFDSQCDGDWEHEFGITLKTVDNPGWYLTIDLKGTDYEEIDFQSVKVNENNINWYFCLVRNCTFEASCSSNNLETVLQIFHDWVEKDKLR